MRCLTSVWRMWLAGALLKCVLRCEDAKKEKEGDPLWLQVRNPPSAYSRNPLSAYSRIVDIRHQSSVGLQESATCLAGVALRSTEVPEASVRWRC